MMMKRCLTSQAIMELEIKTTMRYYLTKPNMVPLIKKTDNKNWSLYTLLVRMSNILVTLENSRQKV
jgi:hypothetical protein